MSITKLTKDAVLRVGEVLEVHGRKISIKVDKNKNLSDMFYDGDILKNISVNSYIEIRKGFLSLIGKVEGEKIEEDTFSSNRGEYDELNKNIRILTVSLFGYIDENGNFFGGTKELPLIGNEAYIVTKEKIHLIHNLVDDGAISITFAHVFNDNFEVIFPVDGLFNSHIAIFGNTGSGKSNTLAYIYQELLKALAERNKKAFDDNAHFILIDFNGEYIGDNCITEHKKVYNLSTRVTTGDRLPIAQNGLLDIEILSILADATEKTQKPFLKRALTFYRRVTSEDVRDPEEYIRNILRKNIRQVLQMSDKLRAYLLLDYFREILPSVNADGELIDISGDIQWHNNSSEFMLMPGRHFLCTNPDQIENTILIRQASNFSLSENLISNIITFLYIQLISDVISNRAQNEHVAPAINKLKSKRSDIEKLFDTSGDSEFWENNFVVVNLDDVNLDMKKTIPLLLCKKLYSDHKTAGKNKSLNIIIDEAHNILSKESFREAESWKDYRLETFEEIIKEGRKFGVFITIASQRPNDISSTITSQAHNYFIHRLINQKDLASIASAVSYIDRITEESIPTLPTGTCIFSGVASQMPLKIVVTPLDDDFKPQSNTRKFSDDIVPQDGSD